MTPANSNSGRRQYFRELMRGKLAVYTLVLGCVGGFVFGASQGSAVIMAAGPAVVVAMVLGVAAYLADSRAAKSFYLSFAETAGLEYVGNSDILPYTPLLGAGDRQHCEHWMTGDVVKEPRLSGALGHFIYEEVRESTNTGGSRRKQHRETEGQSRTMAGHAGTPWNRGRSRGTSMIENGWAEGLAPILSVARRPRPPPLRQTRSS